MSRTPGQAQQDANKWRADHPNPPWTCWYCDQQILVGKGQSSNALAVHHKNGREDPNDLVPVHNRCHARLHLIGKRRPSHIGKAVAARNRTRRGEERPAQSEAMKEYWRNRRKTGLR